MIVMVIVFGFGIYVVWDTFDPREWALYTTVSFSYVYIFVCIYSLYDLLKSENEPVTTQSAQEYVFTRPSDGPIEQPKRETVEMQPPSSLVQPPSYDQVVNSDAKAQRLVAQAP